MRSPAQAIVWEICAKNRNTLLFAFGLIPFCALIEWIVPPDHELLAMLQSFGAIATFVSIVWACSYTANDSRGKFSGFPSWMYTLPLRTRSLVIIPVLLGIALMLIAAVAWELTIHAYWRWQMETVQLGWHALLAIATLVSVQALVWSLHRFRWVRVVALVAVMFGFFYVALVAPLQKFAGGAAVWFGGVAIATALAGFGAIAGVERDRRGEWQGWTGKLWEFILDLVPHRSGAFVSAAHAQLWFEWRRRGIFAFTAFGATMALWIFTYPLSSALYLGPIETLFNFSGPFFGMILFAGVLGTALGKSDPWSSELGVHPVIAVRPLSTSALVFAKMKSAAIVTTAGWLLFTILLGPVIFFTSHMDWPSEQTSRFWQDFPTSYPAFWRWLSNPIVVLALVAATWHTMVQSMCVVLAGNKRKITIAAWTGMIVLALALGAALWLYRRPAWVDPVFRNLPWFIAAMMILKMYGTVRAFIDVKTLVSKRDFRTLLALWMMVAVLILAAGIFAQVAHRLPAALLWLLVLWQFFPANEIPQCVINLRRNRHR